MKKFLVGLLISTTMFSLIACGKDESFEFKSPEINNIQINGNNDEKILMSMDENNSIVISNNVTRTPEPEIITSFEVYDNGIPGSSYKCEINNKDLSIKIIETDFSSTTDLKSITKEFNTFIKEEEYNKILEILDRKNKLTEDEYYISNVIEECLAMSINSLIKNEYNNFKFYLNKYMDKSIEDIIKYKEEEEKLIAIFEKEKAKYNNGIYIDESGINLTCFDSEERLGLSINLNFDNTNILIVKQLFKYNDFDEPEETSYILDNEDYIIIKQFLEKVKNDMNDEESFIEIFNLIDRAVNEDKDMIIYSSDDENWKSYGHLFDINKDEIVTLKEESIYTMKGFLE